MESRSVGNLIGGDTALRRDLAVEDMVAGKRRIRRREITLCVELVKWAFGPGSASVTSADTASERRKPGMVTTPSAPNDRGTAVGVLMERAGVGVDHGIKHAAVLLLVHGQ